MAEEAIMHAIEDEDVFVYASWRSMSWTREKYYGSTMENRKIKVRECAWKMDRGGSLGFSSLDF